MSIADLDIVEAMLIGAVEAHNRKAAALQIEILAENKVLTNSKRDGVADGYWQRRHRAEKEVELSHSFVTALKLEQEKLRADVNTTP